jgi:hypothetical protein
MIAINSSGHLYVCGNNAKGQLGLGSGITTVNTLSLVDSTKNYAQVAAGYYSTHVRTADGQIYSCGDNTNGIIGINTGTTPIYTLTRETTNSTWSSIKTVKSSSGNYASSTLVAFKNNTLYGCGYQWYYGGYNLASQSYVLTREILNLSDITDFYTTGFGTFIKRQGQSNLFAAGFNGYLSPPYESLSRNYMATLTAEVGVFNRYFTKTTIPSSMINVFNYNYNLGYIGSDSFLYTKGPVGNVFAQKSFKAFDVFSSNADDNSGMLCPVFLLSAAPHFRPSPTPTNTPSPTPTPTPAPAGRWLFVPSNNAAGAATNVVYFSNDAITWTPRTISITDTLQGAAYDAANNRIIINSFSQSSISTDGGATWSNGGSLNGNNFNRRMVYGNGVYSGVGGSSTVGPVGFCSTNNGASWQATTMPGIIASSRLWGSITFGQGKFVAISAGTAAARTNRGGYSTDGINWNASTMPFTEWYIQTRYANNRFIATSYTVNPNGNGISYSSDGINWAASNRPSTTDFPLPRAIAFNSAINRWIVTASVMKAAYSDDNGVTFNLIPGGSMTNLFNASTDSLASGQGKFVIMMSSNDAGYTATNQILISQDGLSWTYYPANFRTGSGSLYFLNN